MAMSKHNKGPARWLLLGLSGLALTGFFGAILHGPSPSDASASAVPVADVPTAATSQSSTTVAAAPPQVSQQQTVPSQSVQAPAVTTTRPRFRTRGS